MIKKISIYIAQTILLFLFMCSILSFVYALSELAGGSITMNSNLLMAKVVAKGHDRKKLANILGISYWSVCQKLTNKYEFTHRDMSNIIKEYDLTAEEIKQIFFN